MLNMNYACLTRWAIFAKVFQHLGDILQDKKALLENVGKFARLRKEVQAFSRGKVLSQLTSFICKISFCGIETSFRGRPHRITSSLRYAKKKILTRETWKRYTRAPFPLSQSAP